MLWSILLTVLGAALIVVGVACFSVPLALIVGGVGAASAGLLLDLERGRK